MSNPKRIICGGLSNITAAVAAALGAGITCDILAAHRAPLWLTISAAVTFGLIALDEIFCWPLSKGIASLIVAAIRQPDPKALWIGTSKMCILIAYASSGSWTAGHQFTPAMKATYIFGIALFIVLSLLEMRLVELRRPRRITVVEGSSIISHQPKLKPSLDLWFLSYRAKLQFQNAEEAVRDRLWPFLAVYGILTVVAITLVSLPMLLPDRGIPQLWKEMVAGIAVCYVTLTMVFSAYKPAA